MAIPTGEEALNRGLEAARTDAWNVVTLAWSLLGSTGLIIGVGILVSALILVRTGNWRLAAVPVLASVLQEAIFLLAANIVDRPRPPVAHLDEAPPTASYPSGHVGASTALYVTFALLALPIRTVWVRWLTVVVCLAIPILVAFGRLYRGMHHLTDVGAGFVNGVVCAFLAHWWYPGVSVAGAVGLRVADRARGTTPVVRPVGRGSAWSGHEEAHGLPARGFR